MSKNLYSNDNQQSKDVVFKRFSMFDNAGLDISGSTTLDEALDGAGLNYTVKKSPIFLGNGVEIQDNFATVREDDESHVLGIVGKQYVPVNNIDAFEVAGELVDEGVASYEVGGPSLGAKNCVDYSRSFLALRGQDFYIGDDTFNSFIVFNNSFDGTTGVQYKVICQRLVCLNGMVRMLGGKKSQLFINIQHTKNANDKIRKAHEIILHHHDELLKIQEEADKFINTPFSKARFENEIIPLILKEKKMVENDKERERGQERVERVVHELIEAYNADDTQNYNNSAYKVILALSDYETHSTPLRNTGNNQVYMNRVLKGMVLTTSVAQYLAAVTGMRA